MRPFKAQVLTTVNNDYREECGLPWRWTYLKPHKIQRQLLASKSRFIVVPAGRRSGKTELAKRKLVFAALKHRSGDGKFFYAAPTREQARRIAWEDIKNLIPPYALDQKPKETSLVIKLINGAQIHVLGTDKPERLEGIGWDGGILDEYGNMKREVWGAHIRPTLSDRQGWCWFIGTPEGRNHFYDLYKMASTDESKEWDCFTWPSAGILSSEEITAAKRDLDEQTFRQEYEADFISFSGRAYYNFSASTHVQRCIYNQMNDLIFCFDFNVSPGVAVVCQTQHFPSDEIGTGVIDEVNIPNFSTTENVCDKLILLYGNHLGKVFCYGDATGGAKGSAKIAGTDWDIIRRKMYAVYKDRLYFRVPSHNPRERVRVNAVNSRLFNTNGEVRLKVDPKAVSVIKDFEGVRVIEGGAGEIDKRIDPKLTHWTDALGYYLAKEFPIIKQEISQIKVEGFR